MNNRQRRRERRRQAAADRCLLKYWRQVRIEEELSRLLLPLDRFGDPSRSDSLREAYLPSNPFILSEAGYAGPVVRSC
jgi:hypothetical protein